MNEGYGDVLLDMVMQDAPAPEQAVEVAPVAGASLAGAGLEPTESGPAPVETSPRRWPRYLIAAGIGAAIVEALHAMGVL